MTDNKTCQGCQKRGEWKGKFCGGCRKFIRKYKVDPRDIKKLKKLQSGACHICGASSRKLVVDCDQLTGKVRGLVCRRCILGLHCLASQELLQNAIGYLQYWPEWITPLEDVEEPIVKEDNEGIQEVLAMTFPSARHRARFFAAKLNISEEAAMSRLRRFKAELA